jgi:hypothetical protein
MVVGNKGLSAQVIGEITGLFRYREVTGKDLPFRRLCRFYRIALLRALIRRLQYECAKNQYAAEKE